MAKAPRYICIRKCWIRNTMFMPGNLVKRELIEYTDAEGKVQVNRHFTPIEDTSPEGVNDALEQAAENEAENRRIQKEGLVKAAKDKVKEQKAKTGVE